jgi:hypothetical protein
MARGVEGLTHAVESLRDELWLIRKEQSAQGATLLCVVEGLASTSQQSQIAGSARKAPPTAKAGCPQKRVRTSKAADLGHKRLNKGKAPATSVPVVAPPAEGAGLVGDLMSLEEEDEVVVAPAGEEEPGEGEGTGEGPLGSRG